MSRRSLLLTLALIVAAGAGFASAPDGRVQRIRPAVSAPSTPTDAIKEEVEKALETPVAASCALQATRVEGPRSLRRRLEADALFDKLLPFLDDDQIHGAIYGAVLWGGQEYLPLILDLILKSEDPELLDFCGHVMTCIDGENVELVDRLLRSYEAELDAERRIALAKSLGSLARVPGARRVVAAVLASEVPRATRNALRYFSVGDVPEDERGPWIERIRQITLGQGMSPLRSAALDALASDRSVSGVRFILDRISVEQDPEVLTRAIQGLPNLEDEWASLAKEGLTVLLRIARTSEMQPRTRRSAAIEIDEIHENHPDLAISNEDLLLIKDLLKERP